MTMSRAKVQQLRLAMLGLLGLLYAIFMIVAAFAPGLLAGPVVTGGLTSFWFLYGICLIWMVVATTGLYVLVVNATEDGASKDGASKAGASKGGTSKDGGR